ncbi:MAG TPA: NADH-quinone oxidoreductase subunit D [Candidatus Dormibacteraeota bacterium]|nr:NADH-quinone oxidoreductase subunit D [Candidatus Dormibacteraeota bacterium]
MRPTAGVSAGRISGGVEEEPPRRPASPSATSSELVKINFGPHHPSTHGVLHLLVTLDGETVVDVEPIFGYLHRAIEKLAEQRTYVGGMALCDRLDYVSAMTNNHAWTLAVERLMDLEPPPRVRLIRLILDELSRMASHWIGTGVYGQDIGVLVTSVMWGFNWREEILDVFEDVCGQRMTFNYYRPGTLARDLPETFATKVLGICDRTPGRVEQMERFLARNPIFARRSHGVGVLGAAEAVGLSVTGPTLRASGVPYDVRVARPYGFYPELPDGVRVVTRSDGDCAARFAVRLDELLESARVVRAAVGLLDEVPPDMGREPKIVKPARGREAYVEVEGPKGAVGCYMRGSGGPNPDRMKWRSPSFINLGALAPMARGWKIADLIAIFGSIDINMGEVDR